jgi:hypothetical protein
MSARALTLALLEARAEGASVCPSEVARALASGTGEWRAAMPEVHAAVDRMAAEGLVRLSWKGRPLPTRAGPYRISRAADPGGAGDR